MDEEIITFDYIEIEKQKLYRYTSPIFQKMQILITYQTHTKFILDKQTINTLLVTCMMIIKLNQKI